MPRRLQGRAILPFTYLPHSHRIRQPTLQCHWIQTDNTTVFFRFFQLSYVQCRFHFRIRIRILLFVLQ